MDNNSIRRWLLSFALLLIIVSIGSQFALAANDISDIHKMEAFFDGFFTAQLESTNYQFPGVVVVVTQDDEIVLARGYGYADKESKTPIKPDQTLFRPGSITKLFTWTGIMQLVEEGKLNLDTDINEYLEEIQIETNYEQPITLRHLMTHTAGFEARESELFVKSAEAMRPLKDYLKDNKPEQVYPPGEVPAYSNYGTALAGYIISKVSGQSYANYIEENVFDILAMDDSTMEQPLPEEMRDSMASGYGPGERKVDFELVQGSPAGAMSSTAIDMGTFMIAHLNQGKFWRRILDSGTTSKMHSQHFTVEPKWPGWTYGFIEMEMNNRHLIWHAGDTQAFHSSLVLDPEANLGIYLSYNGAGGGRARQKFLEAFYDRYFPTEDKKLGKVNNGSNLKKLEGVYYPTRSGHSTFEKALTFVNPLKIKRGEESGEIITVQGLPIKSKTKTWIEVGPSLFREKDGKKLMTIEEKRGKRYIYYKNNPISGFISQPWYGDPHLHFWVIVIILLFSILTIVYGVKRLFKNAFNKVGRYKKTRNHALIWGIILSIIVPIYFVLFLTVMGQFPTISSLLTPVLIYPLLILIVSLGLLKNISTSFNNSAISLGGVLYYFLFSISGILLTLILYYWNLFII